MRSFLNTNNEMGRCEYMGNAVCMSINRASPDVASISHEAKIAILVGEQANITKATQGLLYEERDNEMVSIQKEKV